ncbi:MAG: KamA family radical SAM protein [Nitrospinae bacterium]|nr:KamA family radical SAM protein [Nitrospinota bacterium]
MEPPSNSGSAVISEESHNSRQTMLTVAPPPARTQKRKPVRGASFKSSKDSQLFRQRFFPDVSIEDWNDWRWQLRNRVTNAKDLGRIVNLTDEEAQAVAAHKGSLPVGITPYYASLLEDTGHFQPVRRTVIPRMGEYIRGFGESDDPLGEDGHSPVPGIVHRYPDRALFLVTGFCSTYCRYCTRSRMVGAAGEYRFDERQWERAIEYIKSNSAIRDVLLSGGDPLTLPDERLEWLLSRLRKIQHVEFLRIGTKVPAVLPQRVTPALTRILKKYHPLWLSLHFTHPSELTEETAQACERLADAGIPLGSQTVLLAGVNDEVETMKRLFHGLLRIRVRPYYMYQCDPISGSSHFRAPVERGLEIIKGLRGHTTGYASPQYVIDAPGGGGKIPLLPEYYSGRRGDYLALKNYEGETFLYPDPLGPAATRDQPAHDKVSKAV